MEAMQHLKLLAFALALAISASPVNVAAQSTIKIALVGPFSGWNGELGELMLRGASLAIDDINQEGGLFGSLIEFYAEDDACDPGRAVSIANKLTSETRVVAVIGHPCSSAAMAAAMVYDERGGLFIATGAPAANFTDRGLRRVFRLTPRSDQEGLALARYVAEMFPSAGIIIAAQSDKYHQSLANDFEEGLAQAGMRAMKRYALEVETPTGLPSGTDVLFVAADAALAGKAVHRFSKMQSGPLQLVGSVDVSGNEFLQVPGQIGDGLVFADSAPPDRNNPVIDRLRDQGIAPGYDALVAYYAYAAVQVWAAAVKEAGTTNPDKVADALLTNEFNTVVGRVSFFADGDVASPGFAYYQLVAGKVEFCPECGGGGVQCNKTKKWIKRQF